MNRLQHSLAGEIVGFENVERTGVEHLSAGVLDPESTQGSRLRIPQRDLLRLDMRLQYGNERRLVLADIDFLFDLVFEEVAGGFAFGLGALFFGENREHGG